MTTATTNTVCNHTTNAGFQAWGLEIHTQLAAIGLTNTADTGQVNWGTVTLPVAINTAAGYEIWRFNDTLQSTTPIFMKIEYGSGSTLTIPSIWITVGNGSNGAGTLTGLTTSRCMSTANTAPLSSTLPYLSRFCYNTTLGFFGFAWKNGLQVANTLGAGIFVFRSCDSTGAPTSTSVQLLTNTSSATYVVNYGVMQCLNYTTGLVYPPTLPSQGQWWSTHVWEQTATVVGANISIDPVFFLSPTLGITSCLGRALIAEAGTNAVVTVALVGTTTYPYLSVGLAFATGYTGFDSNQGGFSSSLLMLWQ